MKLSAGFLLFALVAATPEVRYFQYQRAIPKSSGQSCFVLDPGIFPHAAPQLADLRLFRDGVETPFVIRTDAPAGAVEKPIAPMNLGSRGGKTVFDAAMPDGHYSDIELAVTGQNFIATVTVSGSQAETGSAVTKIGMFTIFDLTNQRLGRSTVLHLPESDFRYLHFSVAGPIAPENVTGISVVRLPASQPKYKTVAESSQLVQKGRTTLVEFTVPAHLPVERIAFTPGAEPALFSRDVSVSVEPVSPAKAEVDLPPAQPVTSSGNILRVHKIDNGRRIDEERLVIDAPFTDFSTPSKWTITIENGDDAPLKLGSVRLEMLERSLCFEADGNGSYTLYYGDPALEAPRYDYAQLFAAQANASQIEAGAEALNSAYQPRPDDRPFTEKHPVLLSVALGAVIVLLGAIALRSAKRPRQSPE
jgi:hypothetical protein